MSAVVEIWASELEKLKEKVRTRKPFLSKVKQEAEEEEKKEVHEKNGKVVHRETMSEATVCLLMDRTRHNGEEN